MIPLFVSYYSIHCILDRLLRCCVRNPYYLLQGLHHILISILTVSTIYQTIHTIYTLSPHSYSVDVLTISTAFHMYYLTMYYTIFQWVDWVHIIERLFISLPISLYYHSPCLNGYHLFVLSAPFGFDYMTLFFYQNRWCTPLQEKQTNRWLNKWIRMPACQIHHTITVAYLYRQTTRFDEYWWSGVCAMVIVYGNSFYLQRHRNECLTK